MRRTRYLVAAALVALPACEEDQSFEYVLLINNTQSTATIVSDKGVVELVPAVDPTHAVVTVEYDSYEAALADQILVSIVDVAVLDEHSFVVRDCGEICTNGECQIGSVTLQEHSLSIDAEGRFVLPPDCWRCLGTQAEVGSCF